MNDHRAAAGAAANADAADANADFDATALDAEALYAALLPKVAALCTAPSTQLVGILSGGAWLAVRMQRDMQRPGLAGTISSVMHRDDFAQRGLSVSGQTALPFDVNGADIVLLDDVLYTGRTIRAVLNELFDYGRPARVRLAVLVDRGGRELPMQADVAAACLRLPATRSFALARDAADRFRFDVTDALTTTGQSLASRSPSKPQE